MKTPFRREGDSVEVDLPPDVRDFLRELAGEMRELQTSGAGDDDPGLARLRPTAYPDDVEASMAFDELTGSDLARGRSEALDTLEGTTGAERLTLEEADAWIRTLNDGRLVLGTRLEVTEETSEEDFSDDGARRTYGVYVFLGYLVEMLVKALDPRTDAGGTLRLPD